MLSSSCSMRAWSSVGEVLVAVVDRLELAAIDCHDRLGDEVEAPAQDHKLPADALDRLAVVFPEVRDRLKAGDRRPVSQISSTLRCVSRSNRRLDWIRFKYP